MTIAYCRDDPISSRWSGLDRLLTEYEVDYNFYQHEYRIAELEAEISYISSVSVSTITQPSANTLLFTMSDATTQGPFILPAAVFNDRGTWAATTSYLVNDTFTANGALYRVLVDHTSGDTFSPTANDGAGHDYYAAMLSAPDNALPSGGATGQVLQKSSSSDYAVTWGYKLPTGGTTNQVLAKVNNTNQNAAWTTLAAPMITFTPSTDSDLTADNVADAIEQAAAMGGGGGGLTGQQSIWVPAGQMAPLITAGAATGLVETATYKNLIKTLDFDSASDEGAQFDIVLPAAWNKGDITFRVFWSHATASDNFGVVWNIYADTIGPEKGLDNSIADDVLIEATGGVADTLYVSAESDPIAVIDAETGLTSADHSVLIVQVFRTPPSTGDTLAVDARLHGVEVLWSAA